MSKSKPAKAGGGAEAGNRKSHRAPKASGKLLVVDDSALVRKTLVSLLEAEGYQTTTASSGEEAFELCQQQPFDLVLSDVTMEGLSGVQLCRLLRSTPLTESIPIVLLTATDDPRSRFWGRHAGAEAHIAKEAVSTHLLAEVERILREAEVEHPPEGFGGGASIDPGQRLSQILEHHLFEAVLASQVRRLMDHLEERSRFCQEVLNLASEVCSYAYLVIKLAGSDTATYTLHARHPWPAEPSLTDLVAVGIPGASESPLEVVCEHEEPGGKPVRVGEGVVCPIEAGKEILGELKAFAAQGKKLSGNDRETLEVLARELGPITKSLFLMEETRRLALTDGLTKLPNRRQCSDRLEHEVERAARGGASLVAVICDVDHFKQVNDTYGHNVGDAVLQTVAQTLRASLRNVDHVGRWGGEEFMVLLPGTSTASARIVAERLRRAVEQAPPTPDGPEKITMSFGAARFEPGMTAQALTEKADEALYRAKERGRNRVEMAIAAGGHSSFPAE